MGRVAGVDVRETSLRVSFTLNGRQFRRTLKSNGRPLPPTPSNIRYAERLAAEIREKVRLGRFSMAEYFPDDAQDTGSARTVDQVLDAFIAAQRIESSTKAGYTSAAKFWKHPDALGARAASAVKHSEVLAVIAGRPDLSGKTINNYVSVLHQALELAVRDGVILSNPADGVPRAAWQKDPPDPFTRDECEAIITAAAETHPPQVHNLIEAWFWTGMRTSEIFGLTWESVDLRSGTALVAEVLVRGERKTRTKTATARTVPLNSRALAALNRQKAHTYLAGGPVFVDPRYGKPWGEERAFRRSFWTPLLKRLGIRYRRPYNMRHTYATAMLMAGMNPAFCAKLLGHSVEIFHRTYAKWLDGDANTREMARLEAAIGGQEVAAQSGAKR